MITTSELRRSVCIVREGIDDLPSYLHQVRVYLGAHPSEPGLPSVEQARVGLGRLRRAVARLEAELQRSIEAEKLERGLAHIRAGRLW